MEEEKRREDQEVVITEEALKEAEKYIEEEEGPSRRLTGKMDLFITVVAVVMSLVHLYAAIGVIMTQVLRGIHVMFVLFLTFLVFPSSSSHLSSDLRIGLSGTTIFLPFSALPSSSICWSTLTHSSTAL